MVDPEVVELVNQKVIPEFPQDKKQLGILVILDIAISLISLFQNCPGLVKTLEEDAAKVLNWLKHPSFFHKVRLYIKIRRQCRKNHTEEDFNTIVNAILQAGKTATKEDVLTICNAKLASSDS